MLEKISLFTSKREILNFILACGFILSYTLLIEFQNYKNLVRFDSALVHATVLIQYAKTKETKKYQVLKLKSESGFTFYTAQSKSFPHAKGKKLALEIYTDKISFYNYFTSFYANSKVIDIDSDASLKEKLNNFIASKHDNGDVIGIYQALFTATPLSKNLQSTFSTLGVSHLLAISGFHLGVLSALLFFLLKYPYKTLQDRYFPYRNSKLDIFITIASILLIYLLFLESPASLLRAFGMLIVGFILYDRGFKIISMQTLLLTTILLLAFFPRLLFALGFWLSVGGVFYIFLFLIHFKDLSKIWQFILIPFWTYLLMFPYSLAFFGSFSIYHPLSIVWTTLFTLFYPLSIFLHLIGYGNILDGVLESFISLGEAQTNVTLGFGWLILHIILSLLGMYKRKIIWLLLLYTLSIFVYAIYHIT
jgi:competence protein ComEC